MPGKSQMENVVEKLRAELGLYVQLIEGTDCAAATVDAMGMSAAAWAVLGQSPAARMAIDAAAFADQIRVRNEQIRVRNEQMQNLKAEAIRLSDLLTATFIHEMRGEGFGRSKPARRAMAKLAARRGRRG